MNKRIKQLETEAYSHVNSLIGPDDYPTERSYRWNHRVMFNEKFAELIVRECADFIDSKLERSDEIYSCADGEDLRQHFGVEE